MDWSEFAKELSQEGFFELDTEEVTQNVTSDDIASYTGVCSYADIQKALEAQNKEAQLENIWAFFGGDRQEAYYQKKMLSYSFLKHVDSIRFPKPQFGNREKNFALGRAFEDLLTDNFNWQSYPDLDTTDMQDVAKWVETAKKSYVLSGMLKKGEQQKEFEGVIFGYKFKVRLDFFYEYIDIDYRAGLDTKTTSCTSEKDFIKACIDFGYYTQGYVYSTVAKLDSYCIVGTSKKMLKKTDRQNFEIEMQPEHFEIGEKELLRLLQNLKYYGIDQFFKA